MESGAISDQQISASSEKDSNHAATRGRLQLRPTPGTAGVWLTNGSDASPWLQIDLINNGTRVTSVATQGHTYIHTYIHT